MKSPWPMKPLRIVWKRLPKVKYAAMWWEIAKDKAITEIQGYAWLCLECEYALNTSDI